MTDRVRIAVAGLGAVAQAVHLPLLARRRDLFEVVAVCDLSPALCGALGDQYGVPAGQRFGDVGEVVAKSDADALLLLTSGSHAAAAEQAIRGGVPVFCEKPLAYTLGEADRLAEAAAAVDGPGLLLGYMKERDDAVLRLRELLAGVEDVRAVEARVLHPPGTSQLGFANLLSPPGDVPDRVLGALRAREQELLDAAVGSAVPERFRRLYAHVVVSSLIHTTSLLRALFGGLADIDDVRVWPDAAFPPSVQVSGTLAASVPAVLAWHFLDRYPAYRETLTVHHAGGSLELTFGTPYLLNAPTTLDVVEPSSTGERRSTYTSATSSFENELVEFHRMVTAGAAPVAGVGEGRTDIVTSQRIMRRLAEREGLTIGGEAASA
ncbi:MAG: Gfo/Idh/MocA family protein [Actinomycetota bacterium]